MFRGINFRGSRSWILYMIVAGALLVLAVGRADMASTRPGSGTYAASPSLPNPRAVTQASLSADIATWPTVDGSVDGVTYSFQYPPAWNSNLIYCAPGAQNKAEGGHLPAGCASTDVLAGQKARDVGVITGETLTIGSKAARRLVDTAPANVLVSRVYTVMVYDTAGSPLFGFTTQIGAGTDAATVDSITSSLDKMAGTIKVGMGR